jgi:predicted nucleotidyltransferase
MSTAIGDALFTKTQQRVLGLLYGKPDTRFYTNEIVRSAGMGRGTIARELERMTAAGILTATKTGNQLHYQANPKCTIHAELVSIARRLSRAEKIAPKKIAADKLLIGGEIEVSRRALRETAKRFHISRLSLFGSAARNELRPDSDIDLLVEFECGKAPSLGSMVDIQDAFSRLFKGRKVDVATRSILNNPYRKQHIEQDLEELYAA